MTLGLMGILLATGWTRGLRDMATRWSGDRYALALLLYVALLAGLSKLLTIALDYYAFRLEHRYKLSNQRAGAWAADEVKGFVLGLALAALLAELVYATLRAWPEWWWVAAWLGFMGLFVLMAQLAPVVLFPIFYKFRPLEDEELVRRLTRLSEKAGTRVRGVYEWKLSEKSKKANAALTGMGATRRIILSDTLLENYSHDEIEAVLAHELGHHVHGHIVKSMLVQGVVTLIGFWAADQVLRYATYRREMFATLSDFANLPLLALVSTVLGLALLPALNAFSRHNERQADRYCFQSILTTAPFVTAMEKLCAQNMGERTPSRVVEWLWHSHPAMSKRVAAAEAWKRAGGNAQRQATK